MIDFEELDKVNKMKLEKQFIIFISLTIHGLFIGWHSPQLIQFSESNWAITTIIIPVNDIEFYIYCFPILLPYRRNSTELLPANSSPFKVRCFKGGLSATDMSDNTGN